MQLYETLGRELNFNIMLSQRGKVSLAHSPHELEMLRRSVNAIRMNGVDAEILSPGELRRALLRNAGRSVGLRGPRLVRVLA